MKSMNNFIIFICAQNFSVIAFRFFQLLLAWVTLAQTHSGYLLGVVVTVSWIANIIFLPFSGYCLDRYKKGLVIFLANFVSLILILMFFINLICFSYNLMIVILITIILSVADSILLSAPNTIIPFIVEKEKISKFTGFWGSIASLQTIIGALAGGSTMALFGDKLSILIIACLYFVALIFSFILMKNKLLLHASIAKGQEFYQQLLKGFSVLVKLTPERTLCLIGITGNFVVTPLLMILLPVYIQIFLNLSIIYLAIMEICFGLGLLITSMLVGKLLSKDVKRLTLILTGNTLTAISIMLFPVVSFLYLKLLLLFLIGSGLALNNISTSSLRALAVPDDIRGRLESAIYFFCILSIPAGSYTFGIFTQTKQSQQITVIMIIMGSMILFSLLFILLSPLTYKTLLCKDRDLKNYYKRRFPNIL
ncbi:MFS transporter [Fastidiosibacter lacustris]|uniref:MFS transporter n=1 Tax=Fastidiosibacter lacustris TaxID=2056695 RepID=UPI000E34CD95|nr:MFS transporter [Fastidiosibacter lacustris]